MARRMDFSVVGLPHYTIWHLYEPSVEDIRHMEEIEAEKREREKKEKESAEAMQNSFQKVDKQWAQDKEAIADKSRTKEGTRLINTFEENTNKKIEVDEEADAD